MNDTNKKSSLIAIIAIVLVVALIGGVCYGVVTAIGSISDSLYDKLDEIESDTTADSEPSDEPGDEPPDEPGDEPSDSGEAPEVNNNPVYSYANGDVKISFAEETKTGISKCLFILNTDLRKPNCSYNITWDINPDVLNARDGIYTFYRPSDGTTAYGIYYYSDDDGDGVDESAKTENVITPGQSSVLKNSVTVTSNEFSAVGICYLAFEFLVRDMSEADLEAFRADLGEYVNEIIFEELGTPKSEFSVRNNGDIETMAQLSNSHEHTAFVLAVSGLKPDTKYRCEIEIDEDFGDFGFYFPAREVDGVNKSYFSYSFHPKGSDTAHVFYDDRASNFLDTGFNFTTSATGFIAVRLFICDATSQQEFIDDYASSAKSMIKHFRIYEVS